MTMTPEERKQVMQGAKVLLRKQLIETLQDEGLDEDQIQEVLELVERVGRELREKIDHG